MRVGEDVAIMAVSQKVIITCAITGSGHTPSMSPHLPYTEEQVIDQGVAAAEAGATANAGAGAPRRWRGRGLVEQGADLVGGLDRFPADLVQLLHRIARRGSPNVDHRDRLLPVTEHGR